MKCEHNECINQATVTVGTDDRDHHFCREHEQTPEQINQKQKRRIKEFKNKI